MSCNCSRPINCGRCPDCATVEILTCEICGKEIKYGQEYIENNINYYAHYDCLEDVDTLIDFYNIRVYEKGEN